MTAFLSIPQQNNTLYVRHRQNGNSQTNLWLRQLEFIFSARVADSQLTVSELAAQLFLSERQFFRRVKKLTGQTPNVYLRELRLQKAHHLLQSEAFQSVKEIAFQVGFKRADYFSNLFESRFGKRPIELIG